jgi:hypothetical protein
MGAEQRRHVIERRKGLAMRRTISAAQKRDKIDPFSLSFLDIISCGFGAVVVLILIFRFEPLPNAAPAAPTTADTQAAFGNLVAQADLTEKTKQAKADLAAMAAAQSSSAASQQQLQKNLTTLNQKLAATTAANDDLKRQLASLNETLERPKAAGAKTTAPADPDDEAGGILVDRDYVIFIVDTSGSMREIWGRVANRMSQILEQHPRVKGIQVMNDNGAYLFSGYAKRWIPDTPKMRQRILRLFNLWSSTSNSSPAEGLSTALTDFQSSTPNMSIYVLGDDFSGGDFDAVIENVRTLNTGGARINAINFINPSASTDRFSVLMREISLDNHGTLLTM